MNIKQGDIVRAIAGKEKNQIFIVTEVDNRFCWLVDGDRLKLNKPKKKSLKHVQKASKIEFEVEKHKSGQEKINAEIRKFLKESVCLNKM